MKLEYHEPLSNFTFNINLCRHTKASTPPTHRHTSVADIIGVSLGGGGEVIGEEAAPEEPEELEEVAVEGEDRAEVGRCRLTPG